MRVGQSVAPSSSEPPGGLRAALREHRPRAPSGFLRPPRARKKSFQQQDKKQWQAVPAAIAVAVGIAIRSGVVLVVIVALVVVLLSITSTTTTIRATSSTRNTGTTSRTRTITSARASIYRYNDTHASMHTYDT